MKRQSYASKEEHEDEAGMTQDEDYDYEDELIWDNFGDW